MTPDERKRYLGHWSSESLALKDAFRMLAHVWKEHHKPKNCSTCAYAERRLIEAGFMNTEPQEGKVAQ